MPSAVANRFAQALVDILVEPESQLAPDLALSQLRIVQAMRQESPALRNILTSPAVSASNKRAVMARLSKLVPLPQIMLNFLYVLIDHRRTSMLPEILVAIENLLDARMGIARAAISSARPLDEEQRSQVQAALSAVTGKKILGQFTVDDTLIGGVSARVGSTIYDGSVRGRLGALRGRLVQS